MPSFFRRVAAVLAAVVIVAAAPARAAEPAPFTAAQLDQMLAPIALLPDALLAQVLMAATYPSDVALAVDWAYAHRGLKGDEAVKAAQGEPWDPSVQSLVAFPQVLAMLGEKPEWVQNLGDAFLAQPADVMDSVQFLRQKASDAGNLATNDQQVVAVEPAPPPPQTIVVNAPPPPTQIITIVPASPQVVFVPIYNPAWAFGPWWHPAFPPFFFPPPPRWGWGWSSAAAAGFWWGVGIGASYALWGGVDWRRRDVNINVNRWNTINVNNRIDSRDRDVSWRHDVRNRNGVPYRDAATRDRLQQARGDVAARDAYRGRDLQRDQARAELANRVGAENLNRDALRDIDRSQIPSRGDVDRSQLQNRAANVDRPQIQDRAGNVDRSQLQNRAGNVDRPQIQDRAANVDRSQLQDRANAAAAINRDNALRGSGNPQQVRQQIDRGNASRASMQQRASTANTGNISRPSGGNVSRPSAGAAAARRR